MRSRILPAIGVSVVALAVATAFAGSVNAAQSTKVGASGSSQGARTVTRLAGTCYSQRDNDNGTAIVSQNFESDLDMYDSQGTDDFKLKETCKMTDLEWDGLYFNGSGPCDSFNIRIYANSKKPPKSMPGKVIASYPKRSYTGTGPWHIDVPLTKLVKGSYWVSIQCNMNFSTGGEWGWSTNDTVRLDPAKWKNPGDGLSSGCTTYKDLTSCIAAGEGGDFSFSVTR